MMHCGEILFAAVKACAKEVILLGDENQITYINRTPQYLVDFDSVVRVCGGEKKYISIT